MAQAQPRINFSSTFAQADCPDFLDIQIKSFRDFFQIDTKPENRSDEGLFKTFNENFPITDSRNQFVLEFLDYFVDPPRYSEMECIERGLTFSVPLRHALSFTVPTRSTRILRPSCRTCTSEPFPT